MKTANPCRKNYRPEIDPYLILSQLVSDFVPNGKTVASVMMPII